MSLSRPATKLVRALFKRGILLIAFHLPGVKNDLL